MRTVKAFRPKTAAESHRAWLELVETDGPFLAIPPLKRVWPQGMPALADAANTALQGGAAALLLPVNVQLADMDLAKAPPPPETVASPFATTDALVT